MLYAIQVDELIHIETFNFGFWLNGHSAHLIFNVPEFIEQDINRNEWRRRQRGPLAGRKQAPPGQAACACHLSRQYVMPHGNNALLNRRFALRTQDN